MMAGSNCYSWTEGVGVLSETGLINLWASV